MAIALVRHGIALWGKAALGWRWCLWGRRGLRWHFRSGATFDNLIQLTAIQPYTATLRAIINFDTLAVAHDQRYLAYRARHSNGCIHFGSPLELMKRSDIAVM